MARVNLRQLSRQFARGAISKAEYRQGRAELIESILTLDDGDADPTGPNTETSDGDDDTERAPHNPGRTSH